MESITTLPPRNFIRIGTDLINLDHVTSIDLDATLYDAQTCKSLNGVRIHLGLRSLDYTGDHANLLRRMFDGGVFCLRVMAMDAAPSAALNGAASRSGDRR